MMISVGACSAAGPREVNEDSFYAVDFSHVGSISHGIIAFTMVSDGMGGYQGGDVASSLAVMCAQDYIASLLDMAANNLVDLDVEAALGEIVGNAHDAIVAEAAARGGATMGATFIAAFLSRNHAWIAHVGDSRAYLVREGEAIQLTQDHSQVGRMLSQGLITEREAQNHPNRNRIERALGFSNARPDFNEVDIYPGDSLVLCSDGVYTVLSSHQIGACVTAAANAESAAQKLINASLSHHTDDNCTVAVAGFADAGAQTSARKPAKTIRSVADGKYARNASGKHGRHVKGSARSSRQEHGREKRGHSLVVPAIVSLALIAVVALLYCYAAQLGPWAATSTDYSAASAAASEPAPAAVDDQT